VSSSYDFWLTDDSGRKITPLKNWSFFTYSRTTQGFGAIQFGMPYDYYRSLVPEVFKPDWRIDVWRSPDEGFPMRREGSFLLRKHTIYEEVEGDRTIQFFGRSPIDILRRGSLCYADIAQFEKTGLADDVMVEIVFQAYDTYNTLAVPDGEFVSDSSPGLGPSITRSFQGANLLDVLNDIKNETIGRNLALPTTVRKIYFDVVEHNTLTNGGFGYIFRTYADLRGQDRTGSGLIFSVPNGNLRKPVYYEDHLDEINSLGALYGWGHGVGADCGELVFSNEIYSSRWNRCRKTMFMSLDVDVVNQTNTLNVELAKNRAQKVFSGDFLNTPGGPSQPRSLYGVDWDMGDLVRAEFADKTFDAEVNIVHVSVNDKGKENIVGQTEVGG
jgi:hypothetical protein